MAVTKVPGKKTRDIMLYALSTCGWCRKAKELLEELGLEYDYVFVDELVGEEKDRAVQVVTSWNPQCSFPTMVIDNKECITGYDEKKIRELAEA